MAMDLSRLIEEVLSMAKRRQKFEEDNAGNVMIREDANFQRKRDAEAEAANKHFEYAKELLKIGGAQTQDLERIKGSNTLADTGLKETNWNARYGLGDTTIRRGQDIGQGNYDTEQEFKRKKEEDEARLNLIKTFGGKTRTDELGQKITEVDPISGAKLARKFRPDLFKDIPEMEEQKPGLSSVVPKIEEALKADKLGASKSIIDKFHKDYGAEITPEMITGPMGKFYPKTAEALRPRYNINPQPTAAAGVSGPAPTAANWNTMVQQKTDEYAARQTENERKLEEQRKAAQARKTLGRGSGLQPWGMQ